jgi:hypothetical protein
LRQHLELAVLAVALCALAGCGTLGTPQNHTDDLGRDVRLLSKMRVLQDTSKGGAGYLSFAQVSGEEGVEVSIERSVGIYPTDGPPAWRWQGREARWATSKRVLVRKTDVEWAGDSSDPDVLVESVTFRVGRRELVEALAVDGVVLMICEPGAPSSTPAWRHTPDCTPYTLDDGQLAQIQRWAEPR